MKNFLTRINPVESLLRVALLIAIVLCSLVAVTERSEAAAANVVGNFIPTQRIIGYGDATAASTFATTSYADLPGSAITFLPLVNDETSAGRNDTNNGFTTRGPGLLEVIFSADVTKATATTGTCAAYINGAIVTASARSSASAGGEDTISFDYMVANSTVGSQTVKIQCKSGDTNTFTVNLAHVIYKEILPY